jgi:beta-lactamase superfamily II metal-dependent hydrolase
MTMDALDLQKRRRKARFRPSGAGSAILVRYLRHLRLNKINTLIVSHGDDDRSRGPKRMIKMIRVDNI